MVQPRRFSLSLTDAQLDALRTAADTLLNIPSAEATERLFGRLSALDALHGRRIYRDAVKHDAERRARPHASNRRHNRIIGKMACVFVAFSFAAVDPFLTGGTAAFVNATRLAAAAAGDGEPTPLMQAEPSLLRPMWQPTPSIRFSTDVAGRFHSKNGQDQLALSLLGERGFFVDLATNHPVFISNTRALERDHGWTGICIEANPRYWTLIRAVRTCQLAGVAVASDERAVRFVDSRKGGFGHIDREGSQRSTRESEHALEVRTMPLSTVLAELRAPPTISFLSLDVEGAESSVLQSFPWGTH